MVKVAVVAGVVLCVLVLVGCEGARTVAGGGGGGGDDDGGEGPASTGHSTDQRSRSAASGLKPAKGGGGHAAGAIGAESGAEAAGTVVRSGSVGKKDGHHHHESAAAVGIRPRVAIGHPSTHVPRTGRAVKRRDQHQQARTRTHQQHGARHAYVSLIGDDNFVPAGRVLGRSLLDAGTSKEMVMLVTEWVTAEGRQLLVNEGWTVVDVPRLPNPFIAGGADTQQYFGSMSKLFVFNMTQYDRIVFVDADIIAVNGNSDELFECPTFCAIQNNELPDGRWSFNSGVFSFAPNTELFNDIIRHLHDLPSYDQADQGFLNSYFYYWCRQMHPISLKKLKTDEAYDAPRLWFPVSDSLAPSLCYRVPWFYNIRIYHLGIFGFNTKSSFHAKYQGKMVQFSGYYFKPWYWFVTPFHGYLWRWTQIASEVSGPSVYASSFDRIPMLIFLPLASVAAICAAHRFVNRYFMYVLASSAYMNVLPRLRALCGPKVLSWQWTWFSMLWTALAAVWAREYAFVWIPLFGHPVIGWALWVEWVTLCTVCVLYFYFAFCAQVGVCERQHRVGVKAEDYDELEAGFEQDASHRIAQNNPAATAVAASAATRTPRSPRSTSFSSSSSSSPVRYTMWTMLSFVGWQVAVLVLVWMFRWNSAAARSIVMILCGVGVVATTCRWVATAARMWYDYGFATATALPSPGPIVSSPASKSPPHRNESSDGTTTIAAAPGSGTQQEMQPLVTAQSSRSE